MIFFLDFAVNIQQLLLCAAYFLAKLRKSPAIQQKLNQFFLRLRSVLVKAQQKIVEFALQIVQLLIFLVGDRACGDHRCLRALRASQQVLCMQPECPQQRGKPGHYQQNAGHGSAQHKASHARCKQQHACNAAGCRHGGCFLLCRGGCTLHNRGAGVLFCGKRLYAAAGVLLIVNFFFRWHTGSKSALQSLIFLLLLLGKPVCRAALRQKIALALLLFAVCQKGFCGHTVLKQLFQLTQ